MNLKQKPKKRSLTNEAEKIENFTLHRLGEERWKVSGVDLNGKQRRLKFVAKTKKEAIRKAKEILRVPAHQNSLDFPIIEISDALLKSSEERKWSDENRHNDNLCCAQFLMWIDQQNLQYWHELRFEHVQRYLKSLTDRELKYDTIRLYMWPIRRTAKWVSLNWPRFYTDICEGLRIRNEDSWTSFYHEDAGNPVLALPDFLQFLNWLERDSTWKRILAPVSLQGLAGLRLQEALRLTWEKVNFHAGTITVDGAVKNKYSNRSLPVAQMVLGHLQETFSRSDPNEEIITPYYCDFRHYSQAVKRALKAWNPEVVLLAKDLRNTLPTLSYDKGWHNVYVERYLGHSPKTITERHYHGNQGKRLLTLYREKVIEPLEREILMCQKNERD